MRLSFPPRQTSFATKPSGGFQQGIDTEEEKKIAQRKLTPHPESVTTESSVRHLYEPSAPDKQRPMQEGVAHDLVCNACLEIPHVHPRCITN